MIRKSTNQNLYVFSMNKKEILATFKLQSSSDTDNNLLLTINEPFNMSPDDYILKVLSSKKWMHVFTEKDQQEQEDEYKLIKLK
jgi:hypothetical protein